ncbi:site-specific recombinase, phage integrase family (plasmid) [Leptotrichia wadei]|uniref:Site-specific recombinase, phage integrase family n=1 Tax=Leptotrichia wadei TaxID=157687 RepID=A0A510KWB5_9FUSO|nr:tyrosine-type recombinase/integrase [Leptotrichia wadei]BBM55944.1 site-specific recombinase, phage integrase family [Leptotrichia wadei]
MENCWKFKNSDIDLKDRIIKGGLKTEAGKDRLVPIHSKILKLVENRMNTKNEYLIVNFKGKQMKYDNYYKEKFKPIMEELGMNHKPHDTRHTFATLLSNADANKTSVKKLIGHNSYTTTEKFYTHKDIEEPSGGKDIVFCILLVYCVYIVSIHFYTFPYFFQIKNPENQCFQGYIK